MLPQHSTHREQNIQNTCSSVVHVSLPEVRYLRYQKFTCKLLTFWYFQWHFKEKIHCPFLQEVAASETAIQNSNPRHKHTPKAANTA